MCLAFKNTERTRGREATAERGGVLICLSHRFIFKDYTPTNFDTFPAAIMTVFQVCGCLFTVHTSASASVIRANGARQEIQF